MKYENTFVREVKEKNITDPANILNWYRNLYHTEDNHTEHGIVAYAINDFFADVVPKSEVDKWIGRCGDWHGVAELKSRRIIELEEELARSKSDVAREIIAKFKTEMHSEIARNELLAEYGDDFYEGRIDASLTAIERLAEIVMEYSEDKNDT